MCQCVGVAIYLSEPLQLSSIEPCHILNENNWNFVVTGAEGRNLSQSAGW